MERDILLLTLLALGLGVLLGWGLGRRTGRAAQRMRRLEGELEASRQEIESYRERVAEHFDRTSDLLRDLTIRYRGVYDHLADGARALCPDNPSMLGQGIEAALLVEEGAPEAKASEETPPSEGEPEAERAPTP